MVSSDPLPPADLALLERVAARVVDSRLEAPAILALETAKPVSLLAGQAMIFFEPLLQVLMPGAAEARQAEGGTFQATGLDHVALTDGAHLQTVEERKQILPGRLRGETGQQ